MPPAVEIIRRRPAPSSQVPLPEAVPQGTRRVGRRPLPDVRNSTDPVVIPAAALARAGMEAGV
jgi:hypothetical protein